MLSLLKPKLPILGIVVLILGILFGTHKVILWKEVKKAVAETKEQMSAEYTKKLLEASELAREREQVMVSSADKIRKEKDAKIASLNTRLGTALSSLSERPQRPPSSSQGAPASCIGAGATGAQLSREDAEFLVREAARADSLRLALGQCYKQYDAIRKSLN
jgi:Sec-independent protein translocase protein TatA